MAARTRISGVAPTPSERTLQELTAARRELVASVTRLITFQVEQLGLSPEEANLRCRQLRLEDPHAVEADQVSWIDLANAVEAGAEQGEALWEQVKDEARTELATGFRTARSLEPPLRSRPYERAQFAALCEGLRQALAPRDPLEDLLIQQMAAAYELHLRWQALGVHRMEAEVWHGESDKRRALEQMSPAQRERYQALEGWLPPRLSDAAAIEQAVLMADRYQRAFLRLLKAYRDNRRMFGALIVAGGQVNIGQQQVNVTATPGAANDGSVVEHFDSPPVHEDAGK